MTEKNKNNNFRNGLIGWVGGKKILRKTIAPQIPSNIKSYIEPFGGGAWVLFYKDKWADLEIYNDLDGRLVNLFRIVKYHPQALIDELKSFLTSREMFNQNISTTYFTDIQKAAQFYFLISYSFGSKGSTFATAKKGSGGANKSRENILSKVENISKRLDKVIIEHKDFEELIKDYDFEGAFFYCDPPYSIGVGYETTSTTDFEHERLRDVLKDIKGCFLLSYDDSPKIRELYKDFEIIEVSRYLGINHKPDVNTNKIYKELLIANYPIKELFNG